MTLKSAASLVFAVTLMSTAAAQPPAGSPPGRDGSGASRGSGGGFGGSQTAESGPRGQHGQRSANSNQLQERSFRNSSGQSGMANFASGPHMDSSGTGRNQGQTDPRSDFLSNAMKFDLNADRQLAPNELRNLFVVLVSQQQQQQQFNTIRSQAGSGAARNLSVGSATNSPGGNSGTSGSVPIQGLAVQQAIPIFLRLALQFDANHDGQLNSAELTQLATALLQNNLSMLGAAQSGGQSGSTGGGVTVATGQSQNGARFSGGSIPNQSQFQQQSVQIQLGSGTSGGTETREPRSGNQGRSPQASGRNGGSETGRSRR